MEHPAPSARWLRHVLAALGEEGVSPRRITEGSEPLASFDIDERLILRVALTVDASVGLARERAALAAIEPTVELPVPRHHAHGRYDGLAWVAYPKLYGISGRDLSPPDDARPAMAEALGGFLRALHETKPPAGVPHGHPVVPWRGRAEELPRMSSVIETETPDLVNEETLPYLRGEIDPPPGSDVRVLCHGDLKGEHILLSSDLRRITGVVDWNDATVGDPAADVAGTVIWLGPAFGRSVAASTLSDDPHLADRGIFLARIGMLWGLGRSLLGEEDWQLDLVIELVRRAFGLETEARPA